jgi:hypothetical protein
MSQDFSKAVGVDGCGNAFVVGLTNSTNFPVTNSLQSANAGGYDGFIVNFQPGANFVTGGSYTPSVFYSTYLGGTGGDVITGVAVSNKCNATVTGYTTSTNFPTSTGVIQPTYGGGAADVFVTKITQ